MRMKWMQTVFTLIGLAVLSSAAAHAQTDFAASGYEAINTSTSGNGTLETPKNAPGGMIEARHIVSPLIGFGMSYSFNPSDQTYAPTAVNCGLRCANQPTTVTANTSTIGLNWVFSRDYGKLKPFALAGLGTAIVVPTSNGYALNTSVRLAWVYGGGVDWGLSPRFGVRLQLHGNAYKAPNMPSLYSPTGKYMETLEPMIGVYFRP